MKDKPVFRELTICIRLSVLVSSSSGSNHSRLLALQEVLSQAVVALAQKQLISLDLDLDHTQDGELAYLFVVVRQHVADGDNQRGEGGP